MRATSLPFVAFFVAAACGAGEPGQHEVTSPGELLTAAGELREPGWAPRQLLHWDPARVADPEALRQWDFFTIQDEAAAVNLTLVDLGFVQAATIGAIDLATGEVLQTTLLRRPDDELLLSGALEGVSSLSTVRSGTTVMRFETTAEESLLAIGIEDPLFGVPASGSFTVHRRAGMPYLSLATPFSEDPHQFFFEQKVPGTTADGSITIGERTFTFAGAAAVEDWGRGQWPAELTWRWAGGAGEVEGVHVAFNFGEGFGDPSAATENLIVVDDVPFKLADVGWSFDPADPAADWRFDSADGKVALLLHPTAPEVGGLDLGSKYQRTRKGYGPFSGHVTLADGRTLDLDGLLGFAEEVEISW